MQKKKPAQVIESTDTVGSIFTARRDLLQMVKLTIAGSGLTVEEADLLSCLYGVRDLGWDDLIHDEEGFVAFKELEHYLVHNASLLSRRIRKLSTAKPPLVEVADAKGGSGLHFNALRVRITPDGIKLIKPVWARYTYISSKLLQDVDPRLLEAHLKVNEHISAVIKGKRWSERDFPAKP